MGKQNTKASAIQVSQEMEAAAVAEALALEESVAAQQTAEGIADGQQILEDAAISEDQDIAEEKDLIVEPIAPVPPSVPVVEKAVVVEAAKPVAANATTNEQLANILKDVPAAHQIDISRIQAYLERMAPKRPVDAKVGVGEQVALYRSIQNIINRQEEYFTQLFTALLFIFKTEGKSGAMSDRYRMRFMDNITLHQGDRKAFANITQMLHILADAKSRELALGQVNLEKALENGLTAEGRKRVLDYFGA